MKNEEWIDARTACGILSVRPQTLYAYVSRKLLRACSDQGDGRRSLYHRQDVETLAARNRRPRAHADVAARAIRWGDPVLETAISDIREGVLFFGDRPALACAETMTLEDIAAHHWRVDAISSTKAPRAVPDAPTALGRAMALLARAAAEDPPIEGRKPADVASEGACLMSDVANAMLDTRDQGPIHLRMAHGWQLESQTEETLRRALVLMSDHELNPSSFAVRVCASTGGPLSGALLAGLTTLAGPRHGGVAHLAHQAAIAGAQGQAAIISFLNTHRATTPYAFGYGHPLYPEGDPRAVALLERLPETSAPVRGIQAMAAHLGIPPNIDAALAACAAVHDMPDDAAFSIFCIGRLAGWIAHAMEQSASGQIIRPRARFVGDRTTS